VGYPRKDMPKGVPFRLVDYLELVDWTGRAILDNKRGYIPDHKPHVLDRLQIDSKHWLYMAQYFESRFKGLVGASHALKAACRKLKFRRTPNLGSVVELLS
ncbi:MAG: transposase, partial [Candidatus Thiodiazotropha sp. 6PLUC9]